MIRYLDLAEYLWLAEQVTGVSAEVLAKSGRIDLADSALNAPTAGFGGEDFYLDIALDQMGAAALELPVSPASVIVFGSFARREADRHSDIDAVIVRADGVDEDDDAWTAGIEQWRQETRAITGNPVEVIEIDRSEAAEKLSTKRGLWRDIDREGVVVHGETLDELRGRVDA